jgi:hypothetical protein
MSRQKSGAERRRHARVPAPIPFQLSAHGRVESFDLIDLSESGVRIRCARALAAMTRIQVSMVLPAKRVGQKNDVRLETTGVVVWSHRLDPNAFDTGLFFSELDDGQRGVLRAFVSSHVV